MKFQFNPFWEVSGLDGLVFVTSTKVVSIYSTLASLVFGAFPEIAKKIVSLKC